MAFAWFWFLVLLLVIMIVALPSWPYSQRRWGPRWGYAPSGLAFIIFWLIVLLFWFGWLGVRWPWTGYYQ